MPLCSQKESTDEPRSGIIERFQILTSMVERWFRTGASLLRLLKILPMLCNSRSLLSNFGLNSCCVFLITAYEVLAFIRFLCKGINFSGFRKSPPEFATHCTPSLHSFVRVGRCVTLLDDRRNNIILIVIWVAAHLTCNRFEICLQSALFVPPYLVGEVAAVFSISQNSSNHPPRCLIVIR